VKQQEFLCKSSLIHDACVFNPDTATGLSKRSINLNILPFVAISLLAGREGGEE
jgi:hypothetical protein